MNSYDFRFPPQAHAPPRPEWRFSAPEFLKRLRDATFPRTRPRLNVAPTRRGSPEALVRCVAHEVNDWYAVASEGRSSPN